MNSVVGVYSVSIDAEKGLAKIYGEVDPNMLMRAIARAGKHAELVHLDVKHPQIKANASHSRRLGYNSDTPENSCGNEHVAGSSLPADAYYGHEQCYYPNSYDRTNVGYVPSYPYQPGYNNPYDDESFNTCTIM